MLSIPVKEAWISFPHLTMQRLRFSVYRVRVLLQRVFETALNSALRDLSCYRVRSPLHKGFEQVRRRTTRLNA